MRYTSHRIQKGEYARVDRTWEKRLSWYPIVTEAIEHVGQIKAINRADCRQTVEDRFTADRMVRTIPRCLYIDNGKSEIDGQKLRGRIQSSSANQKKLGVILPVSLRG